MALLYTFTEMLGWFVDKKVVNAVLSSDFKPLIEEHQIETHPKRVPMKCLDEHVVLQSMKQYFSFDAWKAVQYVTDVVRKKGAWCYATCTMDLKTAKSLSCDSCLDWHHLKCLGMKTPPKTKNGFVEITIWQRICSSTPLALNF